LHRNKKKYQNLIVNIIFARNI